MPGSFPWSGRPARNVAVTGDASAPGIQRRAGGTPALRVERSEAPRSGNRSQVGSRLCAWTTGPRHAALRFGSDPATPVSGSWRGRRAGAVVDLGRFDPYPPQAGRRVEAVTDAHLARRRLPHDRVAGAKPS